MRDPADKAGKRILIDRRGFIKTSVLTGACAIVTGIPLATYVITPAMKGSTGKWVDFGSIQDLTLDTFTMLSYEFMIKDGWLVLPQRGFVWATTDSTGKTRVFSSTCTHLACNVIWRKETRTFECPCHSGRFDAEGNPISGPPTKPLSVLEHKLEDENLLVYLSF